MRLRLLVLTALLALAISSSYPALSYADYNSSLTVGPDGSTVSQWNKQKASKRRTHSGTSNQQAAARKAQAGEDDAAYRKRILAAIAEAQASEAAWSKCVAGSSAECPAYERATLAAIATDGRATGLTYAGTATPALSPEQVAYIASARLRLTAPQPRIGPSPDLNRWKIAAVGYPLWLWTDGTLNPAPVTDSVYDISVSLHAHLQKVVFTMGDGHKLTCTNLTTPWTTAVPPGTPSPTCGYAYQKPSLPAGNYTVTANAVWAIDWNISGSTGTIPFYQSASTTIPVGELQVLVR